MFAIVALAGCAADTGDPATSTTESELSTNTHTAFNYFVAKGLTKRQSAGIVGNLMQESSVNPTAVQYGGGPGRGIAQWSVGGRWDHSYHDNVAWYASKHGTSRWALRTQLGFIWYELASVGGYGLHALRTSTTIAGATVAFMRDYEICGLCDQTRRITYAHQVYNAYATSAAQTCYSPTMGTDVAHGTCVESPDDGELYACDDGDWVPAEIAPAPCGEALVHGD
ncbi:MAG: phage tail tip lysozyme [Acidobacteriota bacterium]